MGQQQHHPDSPEPPGVATGVDVGDDVGDGDPARPGEAPTPARDPAVRGVTTIADRVVETIALAAVREVSVVAHRGGTMARLVNRSLPRVDASVAGDRVRVVAHVAVPWQTTLSQVCALVRDRVSERVGAMTGLRVDAVDVEVEHIALPELAQVRRVQ